MVLGVVLVVGYGLFQRFGLKLALGVGGHAFLPLMGVRRLELLEVAVEHVILPRKGGLNERLALLVWVVALRLVSLPPLCPKLPFFSFQRGKLFCLPDPAWMLDGFL